MMKLLAVVVSLTIAVAPVLARVDCVQAEAAYHQAMANQRYWDAAGYLFDCAQNDPRLKELVDEATRLAQQRWAEREGREAAVFAKGEAEAAKRKAEEERLLVERIKRAKALGIRLGTVRIGMSAKDVRFVGWGDPDHVNRTTTARGTSEQWVYEGRNYLYFTNGVLTAIQN